MTGPADKAIRVWRCECGYASVTRGGRCRSHPYPARAMGPDMGDPVVYEPRADVIAEIAAELRDADEPVERDRSGHWFADYILNLEAGMDPPS